VTFILHRADRADVLADVLAEILAVPPADPFTPEVVCIHSKGVERWLSHRLSARLGASVDRADGVAANLHFPFPGALVGDALAAATGVERASDPWRPERVVWPLLEVVEACLHEPWMRVLRWHLGIDEPDSSKADRRFATVRHLADLFDSYATHRPDMLLGWIAGRDAGLDEDVAWQAELWRRLRAGAATPSPAERLQGGCAALAAKPDIVALPSRLSLYGLTRLPTSYLQVLQALATHRDVHLLALNPSPAAWKAVERVDPRADDAGERAASTVRHPLLRAWGRDSREMQLVLAARGVTATEVATVTTGGPVTLLQRLQADLRSDVDLDSTKPFILDGSDRTVQVHVCHGRARQAEIARDAITQLLEADPTLEPRDVVVLCPDIDEMAPLFHAAFGAVDPDAPVEVGTSAPALRYRLADRSLRQTNPVLGAMSEILALADARLTATQVLSFAGLPPVRARFALDDEDLTKLSSWINDAGIRWGLDTDHRASYDLGAVDTGTWRAGLRRLLLGVTMTEDDLRLVGGELPLDDVDSSDIALVGKLAELVERLGTAVRSLRGARPLASWVEALREAADLLVHASTVESWQRAQLDHLLDDVEEQAGRSPVALRLAEVRDLLADRLRGQPTRAAFRTGDITLCTLVPMRSVPHRVVCIVGLDDGAFPRGGRSDGDDLLLRDRHLGDHDRPTEDRQLLLDAVLAAGDTLVITYAGRDERTNEVLPPAVPLEELLATLDVTASGPGFSARSVVIRSHPLHATDARSFEADPATTLPWSYSRTDLEGARAASAEARPSRPFLSGPLPRVTSDLLALDDLVAFVKHPARAFLRARLGLRLGSWDDRPLDALGVAVDPLAAWSFGDRVLTSLLAGIDIERACRAEATRGLLPPGALGERVLADVRPRALAISQAALTIAGGERSSLEIDIALPDGRRIVGTVTDVVAEAGGRALVRSTTYSRLKAKQRIAAWVHFVAATAAHPSLAVTSDTIGWGSAQRALTAHLPVLGGTAEGREDQARTLLLRLVDLYDRGMREPIPLWCNTSFAYAAALRGGADDPWAEAEREWVSSYSWAKEDKDPEHVLVLEGIRTLAEATSETPRPDEVGAGWEPEPTRFAALALRLWDPLLAATTMRTVGNSDR